MQTSDDGDNFLPVMPEQSSVSVLVNLSYWDYYQTFVILMRRSKVRMLLFVGVLTAALLAVPIFRPTPGKDWYQTVTDEKLPLLVFAMLIVMVFAAPLLMARKRLAAERSRGGDQFEFSDAGVRVETSVSSTDYKWAAVQKARETRTAFLIYWSANFAQVLPFRCFVSKSDIAALRELIRAHVPKAKLAANEATAACGR